MKSGAAGRGTRRPGGGPPLAPLWALGGVLLLFGSAVARLGGRGLETVGGGLEPGEWAVLVLTLLVFVVGEGWAALDRVWVPRLVRRARALRHEPRAALRLLAPFYGMSLVAAPRRALLRAWGGVAAVVGAVLAVRALPDPWRGIVDLAVAAALLWGGIAVLRSVPAVLRPAEEPAAD